MRAGMLLATLTLAVLTAGCGLTTVQTIGGGPPIALQCGQATAGHGVDVVTLKLTCKVSDAPSGDTSFQLHYSLKSGNGSLRHFDAVCEGALVNGTGTCTQTYALVVPFDSGSATVSGQLLPSHKALGPMPLPVQS